MSKAINPTIQDFRNKGRFQSKDEIFARLQFNAEQHKDLDDELFDFKKVHTQRADAQDSTGIYTPQEHCQVVMDKIKALKAKTLDFDFKNDRETNLEIARLENNLAILHKTYKQSERKALRNFAVVSFIPAIAILIAGTIFWISDNAHQAPIVQIKNVPALTPEQQKTLDTTTSNKGSLVIGTENKGITKAEMNAMLLDGVAKQMAMSPKQFIEQTPQSTIDQVNRIGQMVLEQATKGDKK